MSTFEVEQAAVGRAAVIKVVGEVDLSVEVELRVVAEGLVADGEGPVVMDYTGVDFIDSTGMASLMKLHRRLGEQGRALAIATGTSQVKRMFELTALSQSLPAAPSVDEALALVDAA